MDSTLLHSFVSIEPVSTTKHELHVPPGRAISRSRSAVSQRTDSNVELDRLGGAQGHLRNGRTSPVPRADLAGQGINNTADRDVEMSSQTSIEPPNTFDALPSLSSPPMNKYRLMSCCTTNLVLGLTDAAPGALIPYMETYYNIGYAVVSLIFIGQALGFIAAAPLVDTLRQALGRSRTIMLSQALLLLGYLPLVCLAPFPLVVVGYFFIGFGAAVPLAMNNVFCANLQNGTTMLGFMHGSYGIGGTAAPLVATALVTQANIPWGRYYLLPMALSVLNLILGSWSFRDYEKEQQAFNVEITEPLSQQGPAEVNTSGAGRTSSRMLVAGMFQAFRLRVALLGAFFIFAYQGAEVSISGWVISFLIATRNGDPSSIGYVTSGFWAGITIGRFVLSPLGARVGEKLFVYLLIAGAAVFQLLVWLVPNIIAESVSLAIVGLLLGPVYPCSTVVFARNLSSGQQVSGLSLISAFGTSGGAFAPFTTGLLAQAFGTFVLHPIAIGLFGVMAISWFGQPDSRKRDE